MHPVAAMLRLCAYCGHDVVLREVIKVQLQGDVANLMSLAEAALEAENGQKALEYYTEALEYDGKNSDAWFGRAQAVALTSSSDDLQIRETVSNFRKAIEHVPVKGRQQMAARVARKLNDMCVFFYAHAKELMKACTFLDKAWNDYVEECQRIRITLELAFSLAPQDEEIVENLILLCDENLKGYDYEDRDGGQWSGRLDLNQRPSAPKADALPSCATPRSRFPLPLQWRAGSYIPEDSPSGKPFPTENTTGPCLKTPFWRRAGNASPPLPSPTK
jgi:tetratricopeptide (TPR) repeat protein